MFSDQKHFEMVHTGSSPSKVSNSEPMYYLFTFSSKLSNTTGYPDDNNSDSEQGVPLLTRYAYFA